MPSVEGWETHSAHSAVVRLEPAFFVTRVNCEIGCDPSDFNTIELTRDLEYAALLRALTIADVTDGASERSVVAARSVDAVFTSQAASYLALQHGGFDGQPAVTMWRLRLDANLTASDGQTLGYPWMGLVETVHAQPFVAFDGAVWEAGAGPVVPLYARNVSSITQSISSVAPSTVILPLLELQQRSPPLPPGASETRRLTFTPDAIQAHGLDLRRVLSPAGIGIVWAAVAPGEMLPRSIPTDGNTARSTLLQVTNLGISVKDSPQSTLVFVTRLDTGAPVTAAFESGVPQMRTSVAVGSAKVGTASFTGRSTTAQQLQMPMRDLLKQVTTAGSPLLSISRTGTGRVYYTARLQSFAPEAPEVVDRGFQVERHYEPYVKDGVRPATSSFSAGDLVRVRVALTIRGEGRYLALTDPVPAGFEPIEGWFQTTAGDLAQQAATDGDTDWLSQWRRGTFDYIERHDDRVQAFATRLGSGRHEFTYLARATTAGTFHAPGARVEAMYAPELGGRSAAATITVK